MFLVVKYNYSQSNLIFQHARGFRKKTSCVFLQNNPACRRQAGQDACIKSI